MPLVRPVPLRTLLKDTRMLQSHVITIDGVLVGAAVRLDIGYRFVAIHMQVEDLDTRVFQSLEEVQRLARRLYRTGGYTERAAVPAGLAAP